MSNRLHDWIPTSGLRPGVATYLANVDRVEVRDDLPAPCATSVQKGKVTLWLHPKLFGVFPEDTRREWLSHECGHVVLYHTERRGERDPQLWNLVTDASIHHCGICDLSKLPGPVTYAWLEQLAKRPIPPAPPEIVYEWLKDAGLEGMGCGRAQVAMSDDTAESIARLIGIGTAIQQADPTFAIPPGTERGRGGAVADQAPIPPWIDDAIRRLREIDDSDDDEGPESYHREHRRADGGFFLPVRRPRPRMGARFLVDASGSMTSDILGQFLSAVTSTPELRDSDVVVFDVGCSAPIPASEWASIRVEMESRRGGTAFGPPAEARPTDRPAVWITDGYGDCWPDPHVDTELWVIAPGGQAPPGEREVVRWESSK